MPATIRASGTRDHQGENPKGENPGIGETFEQEPGDRLVLLERPPEIAGQNAADPFEIALIEGHIQALLVAQAS